MASWSCCPPGLTGDRRSGRLLGAQLLGHVGAEIAKRIDILATAIAYGATVEEIGDLDLSYTPPLGSPWGLRLARRPRLDHDGHAPSHLHAVIVRCLGRRRPGRHGRRPQVRLAGPGRPAGRHCWDKPSALPAAPRSPAGPGRGWAGLGRHLK